VPPVPPYGYASGHCTAGVGKRAYTTPDTVVSVLLAFHNDTQSLDGTDPRHHWSVLI